MHHQHQHLAFLLFTGMTLGHPPGRAPTKPRSIHPPAIWAQKCQMLPSLVSPSPEQLLYSNIWVMQRTSQGASVVEGLRAPPVTAVNVSQWVLLIFVPWLPQALSLTLTVVWESFCSAFSSPYDSFALLMTFPVASKNRSSGKQFCKQVSSLLLGGENVIVVVIRVLFLFSCSDQLVEPLRDFSLTQGEKMLMDISIEWETWEGNLFALFSKHFILFLFCCPPKCDIFLSMFFKSSTATLRSSVHLWVH